MPLVRQVFKGDMDTFVVPQNLLTQLAPLPLKDGYFGEICRV